MSTVDTQLSSTLQMIVEGFAVHLVEPDGIGIEQADLQRLVSTLQVMQAMATNLEIEVRCLRDMEAGRDARTFLAEEAASHLEQLLPEVDGNVVKFDFVKRSRS
ncbi:hypothetical protein [Rhizobium sp. 18055]|uniref:hypothetical protein n=1 Tax=Rhizobium sp. 18055 TaxID=2681403 RepID=UPI0013571EB4|nr:hypothetical protein [Rhizobium sp. 18055]